MLREIINRKISDQIENKQQDDYFSTARTNITIAREASISFKSISLEPFAPNDPQTNTVLLDFNKLARYKQDRINFVSVIGCELLNEKKSLIQISHEPLAVLNGISYFLLCTQSCNTEVLKILYAFSQSIYIHQKLLSDLENNIQKVVQNSQTWDVKNYLYIVSKRFGQTQSQLKTSADTKFVFELQQHYTNSSKSKTNYSTKQFRLKITTKLMQKYFSQTYIVNHMAINAYDPSIIKQNLEQKLNGETSRWYSLQAVVISCQRFLNNLKWPAKQFHKINNQMIIYTVEETVLNNLQFIIFQILKNYSEKNYQKNEQEISYRNSRNMQYNTESRQTEMKQKQMSGQRQRCKQLQKQREKQRQKQRQRIKKLKKNIMQPYAQLQQTWLGKTEYYRQKKKLIKQKINKQFDSIISASAERNENIIYDQMDRIMENQGNALQLIGSRRLDGASLFFANYVEKIKSFLNKMVENNEFKYAISKDKPIKNKRDLLSNIQTRIQINQNKKQIVEESIKLALSQQDYLNDILNIKKKKNEIQRKR